MAEERKQLKDKVEKLSALSIPAERKEEIVQQIVNTKKPGFIKFLVPAGVLGVLALLIITQSPQGQSPVTTSAGITETDFTAAESTITTVEDDISDDFSAEEEEFDSIDNEIGSLEI